MKQLAEQTKRIGDEGRPPCGRYARSEKMQGCLGETILQNLLDAEGMVEGPDYEETVIGTPFH